MRTVKRLSAQLGMTEVDCHELAHLRRKFALLVRQVERAARGNPERSATALARKLLRQISEVG